MGHRMARSRPVLFRFSPWGINHARLVVAYLHISSLLSKASSVVVARKVSGCTAPK